MTKNIIAEARALVRARPLRVAYFVAEAEHAHLMLDAIFAECLSRWGGRYSLIVPCENGQPRPTYLPWLHAYDPDVIYSFVDLSDRQLQRLRENLGPAYFIRHPEVSEDDPTLRDFIPDLPVKGLSSLSTALPYMRQFPPSAPQPIRLVDYAMGQPHDRFIDDNFGTFSQSFQRSPIPDLLADTIKPLTVASVELQNRPRTGLRFGEDVVADTPALLHFMAEKRNSFGLTQLAADAAPHLEIRRFPNAFTLVIGHTFSDRLYYWNVRSRLPAFLGRELAALIVSTACLENPRYFDGIIDFLKNRNGVPSNQGPPWIELTSVSLTPVQLEDWKDRFRTADNWNGYHVAPQATLDLLTPPETSLKQAGDLVSSGSGFLGRGWEWKDFLASGSVARPPIVAPAHIQSISEPAFPTQGFWALDVDIERQENLARAINVTHRWRFPRRLRFQEAFRAPYEGKDWGRTYRRPRSTKEGYLTLFVGHGEQPPDIDLPTDEVAFRYAIQRGDTWPPFKPRDPWPHPTGPYSAAQPSDKGRYLLGTLRLLGGLQNAAAVMLHPYWRGVFEELGGAIGGSRDQTIRETLQKKLRTVRQPPNEWSGDTWNRVAALVSAEAQMARVPTTSLPFDQLIARHDPFLAKEMAVLAEHKVEDADRWIESAKRSLPESLQNLCSRKAIFQGYQWQCDTCFNNNWHDISAMQPQLTCAVCGAAEPAPVNEPWSFRLNGFVKDAMKEHGVLALMWCLQLMEERSKTSFFFLGPHDLWTSFESFDQGKRPDAEADLLCVVDCRVHLCEVKSSKRDIDLESLIQVAKRLRPDVVTLAVMEERSQRLDTRLSELREALSGEDIECELLVEEPAYQDRYDAYLP